MSEPVKPFTGHATGNNGLTASYGDQGPLSGQQMQALSKQYAEALKTIKDDLALRKLALDQACNVIAQINPRATEDKDGRLTFHDPISLARAMYGFLVEGAADKS